MLENTEGQQQMDNPENMATQDCEKLNKNTIQYVLNSNMRAQANTNNVNKT